MHHFKDHIFKTSSKHCAGVVTIFFIMCSLTVPCNGQDSLAAPSTRQEAWPEIDVYYRINEKFRLFGSVSGTRLRTSSYTDGGLSVNLDYFALPVWRGKEARADSTRGHLLWFRGGFAYSTTPGDAENSFHDYTLVSEASARFYLPWQLLLTQKNRVDWRWRNEDFLPRYRPKLTLERG